jgi:hypothetical protein
LYACRISSTVADRPSPNSSKWFTKTNVELSGRLVNTHGRNGGWQHLPEVPRSSTTTPLYWQSIPKKGLHLYSKRI